MAGQGPGEAQGSQVGNSRQSERGLKGAKWGSQRTYGSAESPAQDVHCPRLQPLCLQLGEAPPPFQTRAAAEEAEGPRARAQRRG